MRSSWAVMGLGVGRAGHTGTSRSDDASSLLDEAALHAAGLSVPGRSQLDLVATARRTQCDSNRPSSPDSRICTCCASSRHDFDPVVKVHTEDKHGSSARLRLQVQTAEPSAERASALGSGCLCYSTCNASNVTTLFVASAHPGKGLSSGLDHARAHCTTARDHLAAVAQGRATGC